jgi:hypothetical protein
MSEFESKFEEELISGIQKYNLDTAFDTFIISGQTKMEIPFKIKFDYLESLNYENSKKPFTISQSNHYYHFNNSYEMEKELVAQLELVDNKFIVASIKDNKTDQHILNKRYSLEEYNQSSEPFTEFFYQEKYRDNYKERTEDITNSVKRGALDISLPIEHQHFILNNFIDSTPQFAEIKGSDISTSALFKKELNNLAKYHIDSALYPKEFTKQLDIPQQEIDKLIENRSLKLGLDKLSGFCEKLCNENSKEIHKVSLILATDRDQFNKLADIKIKIGKEGQDKVVKIAHDNKQYIIGADIFESKIETSNMFYSLAAQLREAGTENNTLKTDFHSNVNRISEIEKTMQYSFSGIDRDLPIEKQVELGIQELDKEAIKQGLQDHKELVAGYFCLDSVSDSFTTELIEKVADNHSRVISESDFANIYDNDSKLEQAVECFEELHLLSRDIKLSFIEDLKNGSLARQSKDFEAKNGLFEEDEFVKEEFFNEYLDSKGITQEQFDSIQIHHITNALSHTEKHNKDLDRIAIKNRVLSF